PSPATRKSPRRWRRPCATGSIRKRCCSSTGSRASTSLWPTRSRSNTSRRRSTPRSSMSCCNCRGGDRVGAEVQEGDATMSVTEQLELAKVVGPEEGDSFWQPVPANGFIRNIFSQVSVGARSNVSIGTQTLPPGCFIREHTHAKQEEIIYVVEGRGVARIDG